MLKLYNTLTRKKQIFKPLPRSRASSLRGRQDKKVSLYTCGPTVYNYAHIGNLRSYIFADVLRRTLEYNGYKVRWVMNITDIDDKTIKRTIDKYGSQATPKQLRQYTDKYLSAFKKDLQAVNIPTDPKHITFIRVSDKIKEIKDFIKKLIKLGYAYKTDDGVYFNIRKYQKKFKDYGDLIGKDFLKGKKIGARVKVDEYKKENLSDFALWKNKNDSDGNIFWTDKELGDGRPGWHIECSVINHFAFGDTPTDIHTGGVDLIFPHHTNEIAQSQPLYKPFVRYWLHCEHLLANGRKMAKREGNFYTLKNLEKEVSNAGLVFRYLILQTHYRTKMNFTLEALKAAESGLAHLSEKRFDKSHPDRLNESVEEYFQEDLNDDLNTAEALNALWRLVDYRGTGDRADKMADVLGLRFLSQKIIKIPKKIRILVSQRKKLRTNKQFIQADRLRKKIEKLGYGIEDTLYGSKITTTRYRR